MPGVKGRSGGKRAGSGRTPFQPTPEQRGTVQQLAAFGLRHADIPMFVKNSQGKPISEPTLLRAFKAELATGKLKANVKVAQTLYKKALAGDTSSMIFWLKSQAGWKDTSRIEMTGSNGGPIHTVKMTPKEFREIAKTIADEV